jgi:hypothetical protein
MLETRWRGERRHGGISAGVGRHGGDDEADKWGPRGGGRWRRRSRRAAQTRRRGGFCQLRQGHAGRDGLRRALQEEGGARGVAGLRGRTGRLAAGPFWVESEKNSFPNKNLIFDYSKALEICRRRFRRNFEVGIFPKFF